MRSIDICLQHKRSVCGVKYSCLHLAVSQVQSIRPLVESKIEPNDVRDCFSLTPMHWAARSGAVDACRILVSCNGSVDVRQRVREQTPLHFAVIADEVEAISCLVQELGADENAVNLDGCSPLHLAVMHNRIHSLQVLLKLGADPFLQNKAGECCLHISCRMRDRKTVQNVISVLLHPTVINLTKIVERTTNLRGETYAQVQARRAESNTRRPSGELGPEHGGGTVQEQQNPEKQNARVPDADGNNCTSKSSHICSLSEAGGKIPASADTSPGASPTYSIRGFSPVRDERVVGTVAFVNAIDASSRILSPSWKTRVDRKRRKRRKMREHGAEGSDKI